MLVRLLSLFVCAGVGFAASAPALTYSTYLRDRFTPNAIATDSSGNIYVGGGIVIDPVAGQTTALVMKLNPTGTVILYERYLGGSTSDSANAIAVDNAGNAYVAGQTASSDFPVTAGGSLGTAATGIDDERSFVTKLDATGNVVFSDLLGGPTFSLAQAVAVTPAGQVVVSGLSYHSGFPATAGAYSVPDTGNRPYLLELDSTGTKLVFSATGIGGSALTLDSSGNIYVAGSTTQLDYPTTPGAYQTKFPAFYFCTFLCQIESQGADQYVTKVDPTGARLIYSTSVSGPATTTNAGLAVDNAGNAYITGFAGSGYPYTVVPPAIPMLPGPNINIGALPYLSKLDPAGQTLLFSVPAGGAGVQVDSSGSVYVGGRVGYSPGYVGTYAVTASLPALANVPAACLPNGQIILNSAYVSQLDGSTGNVLGTQFVGGSNLSPSAVVLVGSTLWMAGPTEGPDVPISPGALTPDFGPPDPGVGLGAGAYLGAVDFSQQPPPLGSPQIVCVADAADFSPAESVSRYQVVSIIGSGLGPAAGVSATDNLTTSLAGVSVSFDTFAAPLLYVSSTQINFAVPLVKFSQYSAVMHVAVNNVDSAPRQFALNYQGSPHLFLNQSFFPVALNADGTLNSAASPAKQDSIISVFVNGLAPDPDVNNAAIQLSSTFGWTVTNVAQISPFVIRVDVKTPEVSLNLGLQGPGECSQSGCISELFLLTPNGTVLSPSTGAPVFIK